MQTTLWSIAMFTRLVPTIIMLASLFALGQPLRAEDGSKADKLRAEAKRLLQLANEVERQENADAGRKEDKPKGDKPAIKKPPHEGDIKPPAKPDPKKGDKPAVVDKKPAGPKVPGDKHPGDKGPGDKHPHHDKAPIAKDLKPVDGPPRVKLTPDGKPLPFQDKPLLKSPPGHAKPGPDFKGPPPMKQPPSARGPVPGHEAEQKLMHMMHAARHLREAGMVDMAANLEKAAGEMKRHIAEHGGKGPGPDAGDARQVIDQLRREIAELRETVKRMQHEQDRR